MMLLGTAGQGKGAAINSALRNRTGAIHLNLRGKSPSNLQQPSQTPQINAPPQAVPPSHFFWCRWNERGVLFWLMGLRLAAINKHKDLIRDAFWTNDISDYHLPNLLKKEALAKILPKCNSFGLIIDIKEAITDLILMPLYRFRGMGPPFFIYLCSLATLLLIFHLSTPLQKSFSLEVQNASHERSQTSIIQSNI